MFVRLIFSIFFIVAVMNLIVWQNTEHAYFCLLTIIAIALVEIYDKEKE